MKKKHAEKMNFDNFVASVLECSIYHFTSFEKNEFENFGILIFDMFFVRDIKSTSGDEMIPIQLKLP